MTTHPFPYRKTVLALTASIVLSGCTSPIRSALEERTPTSWSYTPATVADDSTAATSDNADAKWWNSFEDATLLDLVLASQSHPSVDEARSRWKQAAAVFDATVASGLPSLSLTATGAKDGNARGKAATEKTGAAQLGASWEPDFFGRVANASQAANQSAESARFTIEQTKVAMAASTATTYINLLQCESQAQAYQAELDSYELESSLLKARQDAGLLAGADLATFDIRVQQAKTTVAAQLAACKKYRLALVELTGWPIQKLDGALTRRGYHMVKLPKKVLPDSTPASALARRPDIQAAMAAVLSSEASAQVAEKNQLPHISLTGMIGLTAVSTTMGTLAATPWSSNATVSWALFSGGKLKAERKQAKALVREKTAALDRFIRKAVYEVEAAVLEDHTSRNSLNDAEANLNKAQLIHTSTKARVKAGLADGATLIRSERDLRQAQQAVMAAKTQYLLAVVSLYKALGGAIPTETTTDAPR